MISNFYVLLISIFITTTFLQNLKCFRLGIKEICKEIEVSRETGIITATCQQKNKLWKRSSLELYKYLGNNNGRLEWGLKNYHLTCTDCLVRIMIFQCSCRNNKKENVVSSVDHLLKIGNNDGELIFIDSNNPIDNNKRTTTDF